MERLVDTWEENGERYSALSACRERCVNNGHSSCYCAPIVNVRQRLCAYEDTGLTPEDAAAVAECAKALGVTVDKLLVMAAGAQPAKEYVARLEREVGEAKELCKDTAEYLQLLYDNVYCNNQVWEPTPDVISDLRRIAGMDTKEG